MVWENLRRSWEGSAHAPSRHPHRPTISPKKHNSRYTEGQYFEGVCIAKKNRDLNSSFTVRKISFGEGVERTFALYSPNVDSIKVIRSGKVRRAKLYYLRDRKGKSARIAEKIKKKIGVDVSVKVEEKIILPASDTKTEKTKDAEVELKTEQQTSDKK